MREISDVDHAHGAGQSLPPSSVSSVNRIFEYYGIETRRLWRQPDNPRSAVANQPPKLLRVFGIAIDDQIALSMQGSRRGIGHVASNRRSNTGGGRLNNQAENSHQTTRERERRMRRFKSIPQRAAFALIAWTRVESFPSLSASTPGLSL